LRISIHHGQRQIKDGKRRGDRLHHRHRIFGVGGLVHGDPVAFQNLGDHRHAVRLVFNNQHLPISYVRHVLILC
jgi:hypothetical protein